MLRLWTGAYTPKDSQYTTDLLTLSYVHFPFQELLICVRNFMSSKYSIQTMLVILCMMVSGVNMQSHNNVFVNHLREGYWRSIEKMWVAYASERTSLLHREGRLE